MSTCNHCHQYFRPKYPGLKLCYTCWQKKECAFMEYDSLLDQVAYLNDKLEMERLGTQQEVIPAEKIRQLLSLCHPDRHHATPREATANEVTQWLNEMRKSA